MESNVIASSREPWNKGKIVGQKAPFKVKDVWALRADLKVDSRIRELALFNRRKDRLAQDVRKRHGRERLRPRPHTDQVSVNTARSEAAASR
jgi:hypothetical protein